MLVGLLVQIALLLVVGGSIVWLVVDLRRLHKSGKNLSGSSETPAIVGINAFGLSGIISKQ